jgi:hypothetical protein
MLSKILGFFLKLIEAIILIVIFIILVFSDVFSSILLIDTNGILAVLVGVTCLQIISSYVNIKNLNNKIDSQYAHGIRILDNISDAYNVAFKEVKHIKRFRAYCITSSVMAPQFDAYNDLIIDNCTILLRKINQDHYLFSGSVETEIYNQIERWKKMVNDGRIKKLTIVGYDNISDMYYALFDNKLLITDIVNYDINDTCGQSTFRTPLIFSPKTISSRKIIDRYILQFDNYVSYYKRRGLLLYDSNALIHRKKDDGIQ